MASLENGIPAGVVGVCVGGGGNAMWTKPRLVSTTPHLHQAGPQAGPQTDPTAELLRPCRLNRQGQRLTAPPLTERLPFDLPVRRMALQHPPTQTHI